MASQHKSAISVIRGAVIDGRLDNIRYRQDQLTKLHRTLVSSSQDIVDILIQDTQCTLSEAKFEVAQALSCLRTHYDSLDFSAALEQEYQVTHGLDFSERRKAVGVVSIKPARFTPLFSTIAPLTAALASGNCIILELETSLKKLPASLKHQISAALDSDIITITSGQSEGSSSGLSGLRVEESEDHSIVGKSLALPSSQKSIAVVDRTADVVSAAEHIIRARFGFRGRSPYAPDVVLVNEFVKKAFLDAAVQQSIKYSSVENGIGNGAENPRRQPDRSTAVLAEKLAATEKADIVFSSDRATVISLPGRQYVRSGPKTTGPLLLVASISSLDDAIDLANSASDDKGYLSNYVFGNEGATKYLSQFIEANASFLNHIPRTLNVGPAGPSNHVLSPVLRFTPEMFSHPRPQFVQDHPVPGAGKSVTKGAAKKSSFKSVVASPSSSASAHILSYEESLQPLKPTGQPLYVTPLGFFEQGIVTGLTVFVLPTVIGAVVASIWAGRAAWQRFLVA